MKIVVFGSTGKIGKHVVELALEAGHAVRAFARNPSKLDLHHKNLSLFKGDVLDRKNVAEAVKNQDGVVCALGMPLMNKEGLRAKGTLNIVDAMVETNVRRLSCLSVFGANDSWLDLPFTYKYLIAPLLLRHVIADHEEQEAYIKNADIDWTIVRATNFTTKEFAGNFSHGFSGNNRPPKMKINQQELARFLLEQLTSDTYLHHTPAISR